MSRVCLLAIATLLACAHAHKDQTQEVDCSQFHEEYEKKLDCYYGLYNYTLNGCIRYECREDPCIKKNCSSIEHCERIPRMKRTPQGDLFSAFCVSDVDCEPFEMECNKHCDFGIEKTRGADGCDRCKCKQDPCNTTSCAEGLRCVLQSTQLNNKKPKEFSPKCETVVKAGACPAEETSPHNDTCPRECADDADCRGAGKCCPRGCSLLCLAPVQIGKEAVVTGELYKPLHVRCKLNGYTPSVVSWLFGFRLLNNDTVYEVNRNILLIRSLTIDTLGEYKCSAYDVEGKPVALGVVVQAYKPDGLFLENRYLVPRVMVAPRPSTQPLTTKKMTTTISVTPTTEAIKPTIIEPPHCENSVRSNEPHSTDCTKYYECAPSGPTLKSCRPGTMYNDVTMVCDWSYNVVVIRPECDVTTAGPVMLPAGIAGDENATVTGELGQPLHVGCLAYGYPPPIVLWYRGRARDMELYNDEINELTVNGLLIKSLSIDTLGPYTCLAFNGAGKAALWRVVVRAYRPEGLLIENEWLVPRDTMAFKPMRQPSTTDIWLFNETSIMPEITEIRRETTGSFDKSEDSKNDEGTTDFIGTSTLDPCHGFQFCCCADNETEVSGPNVQGCPCNATEYSCCPNGVSPATGRETGGFQGSCSTSPHGCCQDNKTPAHGSGFEGCCLLFDFGCCPDNRQPAKGHNFDGCECQYTLHGCCPDNVTIAQGPDNLGCGCQYTQHGCCPDSHTAASGPNNEGCACNTYQFGCCDDGVTTATGPDKQGCHCRDSKFGCCGDGETHATGPDAAGCDCSFSQHGCCPDGRTEAAGPKFLGCADAPENKQAVCSMPTDSGRCYNITAMWYYDLGYGGCSRFFYGGCDGNDNRFVTKEECEDVCTNPSPEDTCKLPSVKGACDADFQRWYYNSTREQCISFRYGGCLGNANNFDTRELCQKQCEPSSVTEQCNLPIDQGSCAGNYSRWGFNSEAHRCEQFTWGGCEGNSNRFSFEAACQMRCVGTQPHQCTQPQEAGNCGEKEALWSFSQSENRCLPFYYSGCEGNDNRFRSREACEQTCPSAYVPDKCTLPAETGLCSNYRERWFYDTTYKRCRQFYYGGCSGNENNFATEMECDNSCSEIKTTTTTTTTTTARPVESQTMPSQRPEQEPKPIPGPFIANEFLVPRGTVAPRPRTQPPTTVETTTITSEASRPLFTVPVSTHVSTPLSTLNVGADLRLACEVDGFPEPDVHWTKDGIKIQTDGRKAITGNTFMSRLTVTRVSVADSGLYACHASNPYSSHSDTAQINVQQFMVPANCTDNPFFADCDMIVRYKFCRHHYFKKFCCKSCVEAGQLDPQEAALQEDQPL